VIDREKSEKLASTRQRLKAEKKQRIVEATLETIAEHGVRGTTTTQISRRVGLTHSALYAYFPSRRDILLAALDAVFERIYALHMMSDTEDAVQRLRKVMRYHSSALVPSEELGNVIQRRIQFVVAPPSEGLAEAMKAHELQAARQMADMIELGKRQGTIKQSVDSNKAAWMFVGCIWAEDTAFLADIECYRDQDVSFSLAELLLDNILVDNNGCAAGW
jgi:AcrR family transcriptional regulator